MRAFSELYARLDETTKTLEKVEALRSYFAQAAPEDAAWAAYLLVGRKLKQAVSSTRLREWAAEAAGLPDWLFQESYDAVGDVAETIALVLPPPGRPTERPLHVWIEEELRPLASRDEPERKRAILDAWDRLDARGRMLWNKFLTGGFRVGVSRQLVVRAIAEVAGADPQVVAHRMMGDWRPAPETYQGWLTGESPEAEASRPYPFYLAHPLEGPPEALGPISEWSFEWKWDGIRAQVVCRKGAVHVWTRGEELATDRYPEVVELAARWPEGTVVDGELLPWRDGAPLPFASLQRRIGRKTLGATILRDVPVALMAYDLLEDEGVDVRGRPWEERRAKLDALVLARGRADRFMASIGHRPESWEAARALRDQARAAGAEGLMVKRRSSAYQVGRVRGDWWKWKVGPYVFDAVLVAAQRGSGKRASLYTDYTFAVWGDDGTLVPVAKAYSGLTDEEIKQLDAWVRKHLVESFGPVRTVAPLLVFELAFEAIARSPRHKGGVAVRFPRILRRRDDKRPEEADALATLRAMLAEAPPEAPKKPKGRGEDLPLFAGIEDEGPS